VEDLQVAAKSSFSNSREWQGRKDSNPRPSVLETDALTRLSYAPMAERKVYPTSN
jgi:hypothetical protein